MEIEPIVAAIERARDLATLTAMLSEWRDGSGLAHLVYHAVHVPLCAKADPVLIVTYDGAWVRRYVEQGYFQVDPVVIAGRAAFLPIDWMTVDHETPAARHFFAEAESHGVGRHGITLPIRGINGERALFTFTSNQTDDYWHRWRYAHLRDFHLVANYLHDRAMQLAGMRTGSAMRPLSRRERQCVQGLADGRTPQQIAVSLKVSASAVHLYLGAARRKLDCATIDQAVAKAICFELIQYNDTN
jgi:DNA-binding CsgD family transcriptional regulator